MSEFFIFVVVVIAVAGLWRILRVSASTPDDAGLRPRSLNQATQAFHWPGKGDFDFEVVGESFYQKELARLAGSHGEESVEARCIATIVPEDNNKHDPKAVAVLVDGRKVAHLSRDDARSFRRRLGQKKISGATTTCDALVVGGGTRRSGEKLMYGVKLDIKPFE